MTAIDSQGSPINDSSSADDDHGHHDHPENLAHHWDNLEQQYEANKLGMWLFLATEFLLFGGLFVAYAVLRFNKPELFEFGSKFLDTKMGAINTVILIASSFTMALAVWAAQLGKRKLLIAMLICSFMGGVGFMTIKYFEYSHKLHLNIKPGPAYYVPVAHGDGHGDGGHGAAAAGEHGDDADHGDEHAAGDADGEGHADDHDGEGHSDADMGPATIVVLDSDDPELPGTEMVRGTAAPRGLARLPVERPTIYNPLKAGADHGSHGEPDPREDPGRPANPHLFFGIYYCMTGLHGIHVLIGMGVIGWLTFRAVRGDFGPNNFTAVDLGGLYWHVVDMIWIFLFPLLYLIH